ncbi:MAG: recombinase family protein [Chloroflexi bacterium]|nr:MAG: recombinase family protein [Chloroflexota bacterium]
MKRAVIYARTSYDDRDNDSRNLRGQIEMGREYAEQRGYRVIAEMPESERGASGASIDLPVLNQIREMAQSGEFDILIVRELDRLSRNLAKQLLVEKELEQAGVTIEYVLGDYSDTPEGQLQKHIKAVIAEYEREKIKERMLRGKHLKLKSGYVVSGHCPYGYRITKDDAHAYFEIYEPEARIVRRIFDQYIKGITVTQIKRRFVTEQILTPAESGNYFGVNKQRGPYEWSRTSIYSILNNQAYAGIWHFGKTGSGETIPVEIPAIIDLGTFEAAQKRKQHNTRHNRRNRKHQYLLATRCRCDRCKTAMSGNTYFITNKAGERIRHQHYRCRAAMGQVVKDCDAPTFRVDEVDYTVWCWVEERIDDDQKFTASLQKIQAEQKTTNAPLLKDIETIDGLISDERKKLERLLDMYVEDDEIMKEAVENRKRKYLHVIRSLQRQRAELDAEVEQNFLTDAQIESARNYARKIRVGMKKARQNFAAKRQLIEILNITADLIAVTKKEKYVRIRCIIDPNGETIPIKSTSSLFQYRT